MRSKSDYAVYYKAEIHEKIIIGVYVDDMIITGLNSYKIVKFKENMKQVFKMTDFGILSSYLGIEIKHEASCTWLNQKSYIQTILHAFKMSKMQFSKNPDGSSVETSERRQRRRRKSVTIHKSHWQSQVLNEYTT